MPYILTDSSVFQGVLLEWNLCKSDAGTMQNVLIQRCPFTSIAPDQNICFL